GHRRFPPGRPVRRPHRATLEAHSAVAPARATSSGGASRLLAPAVGPHREATGVEAVDRVLLRPRPATEAGAAVVGERLVDLGLGVHHERAVAGLRLADRSALQEEHLSAAGALEVELPVGADDRAGATADVVVVDAQAVALEHVERADR